MAEAESSDRVGKEDSICPPAETKPDDGTSKPKDTLSTKQGDTGSCQADSSSSKVATRQIETGDGKNGSSSLSAPVVPPRPRSASGKHKRDETDDDVPRPEKSLSLDKSADDKNSSSSAVGRQKVKAPPAASSSQRSSSQSKTPGTTTSSKPIMKVFGSSVQWNPAVTALTSRLTESDAGNGTTEMERLSLAGSPKLGGVPINERKRTAPHIEDTNDDKDDPSLQGRDESRVDSTDPSNGDESSKLPPPTKKHHKNEEKDERSASSFLSFSSSSAAAVPAVEITTGEESDTTKFKAKTKLFQIVGQDWKERGVGDLKLNENREDNTKARLLLRAEGTQRLVLNSPLVYGMMNNLEGKWLRFHAFTSDKKPDVYAAKMDSHQTAESMHDLIQEQLEKMKQQNHEDAENEV